MNSSSNLNLFLASSPPKQSVRIQLSPALLNPVLLVLTISTMLAGIPVAFRKLGTFSELLYLYQPVLE